MTIILPIYVWIFEKYVTLLYCTLCSNGDGRFRSFLSFHSSKVKRRILTDSAYMLRERDEPPCVG